MSIIPFPTHHRPLPAGFIPASPAKQPVKPLDQTLAAFHQKSPLPDPPSEVKTPPPLSRLQIIARGRKALEKLTGFIGPSQAAAVKTCLRGEEGEWFMEKMEELAAIVENMPVTYGQDGKGDDTVCYLRYFAGGDYTSWLTEKDMEEPEDPAEAQWQAYGRVHWGRNGAHLSQGYICLPEIFKSHAELDFHFTPCTVREIKQQIGMPVDPAPVGDRLNSDSNLSSLQEPFDRTATAFQSTIRRLATITGIPSLRIYKLWREYSEKCTSYDQSAVLSEFIAWYRKDLDPSESLDLQATLYESHTSPEPPPEPPPATPPTPEPPPANPENISRIKQKLAKLLRLGENEAASEGEISNALEIATALMAKHQLSREDIDLDATDPAARVALGRHFAFCKGANLTAWESQLTHFVTKFIGSVSCYNNGKQPVRRNGIASGGGRTACCIAFYGSDEDARCAAELFEELRDTIATMAIVRWGGWARGDGAAYALGFASSLVAAQESSTRNLMNTDAATTALILKSQSASLAIISNAKAWLSETHGVKLQSRTSSRRTSLRSAGAVSAFHEGKRDGSNYQASRPSSRPRLG